jgi:hypothetical protein
MGTKISELPDGQSISPVSAAATIKLDGCIIGSITPKAAVFVTAQAVHLDLGTSDPMVVAGLPITSQLQINSDTLAIEEIHTHSDAAGSGGIMYMARSRGTTANPTIVSAGDYLGSLAAVGYDGADYAIGAFINFIVAGSPGSNDMPTKIDFQVTPDGGQIPETAFTINSNKTAAFSGYILRDVDNALTSTGTSRTDALQLAAEINNITTAALNTGSILPTGSIGMRITVFNAGSNPIKVYANGSETIDGTSGSSGVTLTNAKRCDYFMVAANTWISAQLGVVSA